MKEPQPFCVSSFAAFVLWVAILALPRAAHALQCFGDFRGPSELAAGPAAERSTSLPVTFGTGFATREGCEYGLSSDGGGAFVSLPASATDFASLVHDLLEAERARGIMRDPAAQPPRSIYARPRGATDLRSIESVFLESCSETIFTNPQIFQTRQVGDELVVTRISERCGAGRTALRFEPVLVESSAVTFDFGRGISGAQVSLPGSGPLRLPARTAGGTRPARYAVYAARAEGSMPVRRGFLVGYLRAASNPVTPLRAAIVAAEAAPEGQVPRWFRAAWSASGGLELIGEPGFAGGDTDNVWAEMRSAAVAGQLWLADARPDAAGGFAVHGPLYVRTDAQALALPDEVVERFMVARYGDQGRSLVPSVREWDELRRSLALCVIDQYQPEPVTPPARLTTEQARGHCAPFEKIVAPVSLQLAGAAGPGGLRVCVRRWVWNMTVRGPERGAQAPELCTPGVTDARIEEPPLAFVSVGDALLVENASAGLYVCTDNECVPLVTGSEGHPLRAPGLVELRRAGSADAAASRQGVTLWRVAVIAPASEWHPVGLLTTGPGGQEPAVPQANVWAPLPHDEHDVFAFIRRRQEVAFRLSTSPSVSAAWNATRGQTALVTQDLPVVQRVRGVFPGARPSALVVVLSRHARCPSARAAEVRTTVLVDPDALLPDSTFYAFLAQYEGEERPYQCLARAAFRIRDSRVFWAPTGWFRTSVLGDLQLAGFFSEPISMGLILPVVYAQVRLPYGFGFDASASLTAALSFERGQFNRLGAGLSVAAFWGPAEIAPRLISFGVMLHGAARQTPDYTYVSPYLALDLATLFDLAGGR